MIHSSVKSFDMVNCKLSLSRRFKRKTVESVLKDLNYKLISFSSQTNYPLNWDEKPHTLSVITFTTAEG